MTPEEWISQAEAARIRKTTRQAIARLIARNRLRTLRIAGRTLVNRDDVLDFLERSPGRRSAGRKTE